MRRELMYRTVGHRTVQGWILPEMMTLVSALSRRQRDDGIAGHVVEIGVHHGRFCIALDLLRGPDEKTLAIDLFDDQELNPDHSGRGDRDVFIANMKRHAGPQDGLIVHSGDSMLLTGGRVRDLLGGASRLFSVDGGHTSEIVQRDMQTAAEALVSGGIVIADDVFNERWPGVAEGTHRYLDQPESLTPFGVGYNKLLLTTSREHAVAYRDVMKRVAERRAWGHRVVRFHGHDVAVIHGLPLRRRPKRMAKQLLGVGP